MTNQLSCIADFTSFLQGPFIVDLSGEKLILTITLFPLFRQPCLEHQQHTASHCTAEGYFRFLSQSPHIKDRTYTCFWPLPTQLVSRRFADINIIMDSMRTLNTSLPRTSPRRRRKPTPGELHQAFKSAALTTTQLYKTAVADSQAARNAGYQDALDDVLGFLDEENLGLGDGEGWRVRQWATQHLKADGSDSDADSDDEKREKRARTSSPILHTRPNPGLRITRNEPPLAEPTKHESSPPRASTQPYESSTQSTHNDMFHFTTGIPFPNIHDVEMTSVDVPASSVPVPIRLDQNSRPPRSSSSKHIAHSSKERGSSTSLGALGHGAGSKRKGPFNDFFDVNNPGGNKDGHGGGKKGRHA